MRRRRPSTKRLEPSQLKLAGVAAIGGSLPGMIDAKCSSSTLSPYDDVLSNLIASAQVGSTRLCDDASEPIARFHPSGRPRGFSLSLAPPGTHALAEVAHLRVTEFFQILAEGAVTFHGPINLVDAPHGGATSATIVAP